MPDTGASLARATRLLALLAGCVLLWSAVHAMPASQLTAPVQEPASMAVEGTVGEARGDSTSFLTCHLSCACFFVCHTVSPFPYTPALVSPANGSTVPSTPTLTATYSHSTGTRGDLLFQLCSDSACTGVLQSGTDTNVASGSNGSWTPTALANGTYYWRARGYDGTTYSSYSASWSFTIGTSATPPSNTALPTISGTTRELQTLTASTGTWSGTTPITYAYQWRRCDSAGANCADIAGATSSTVVLDREDVGLTIRVVVTATNSAGSSSATSNATAVIAAADATYVNSPGSSTSKTAGSTLVITTGVKSPANRLLVAVITHDTAATVASVTDSRGGVWYQDRVVANGTTVTTSVWSTYTTKALPSGSTVTATWSANTNVRSFVIHQFAGALRSINATGGAAGASTAPSSSVTTTTARTLLVGAQGTNGPNTDSWTAAAPFTLVGITGTSGGGGNTSSITQRHAVTATGSFTSTGTLGSSRTWAAALVAYGAVDTSVLPPVNTALPTISGTASVGSVLTGSNGTWANSPTAYAYQWERCDSAGDNCAVISGAASTSYTVQSADTGSTLRFTVTASNAGGATSATSVQTAVVPSPPPSNTGLPSITGTTTEGSSLTAVQGTWSGSPTSYAYQWQRCDAAGASCTNISGATGTTHVLTSADVDRTVRVVETATNSGGSTSATSAATALVAGLPPVNTTLPSISGTAATAQTLTAATGGWSGTTPLSYAYQWQRCDSAGASCASIAGATASAYTLTSGDVDSTIRVRVTATNTCTTGCGSASATSAQTAVVVRAAASLVHLTGFEHGAASSSGGGAFTSLSSGEATVQSAVVRTGGHALRIASDGTSGAFASLPALSASALAVRVAVRIETMPSGVTTLMWAETGVQTFEIQLDPSTNRLRAQIVSSPSSTPAVGPIVSPGAWYVIELLASTAGATDTLDWSVDGVSHAQTTLAGGVDGFSDVSLGAKASGVHAILFDDMAISATAADYPIGDGTVIGLRPVGMTAADAGVVDDDDTAVDSTSWARIDDQPMTTSTDYVKATATAAVATFAFGDTPKAGTASGIRGVLAYHAAGSPANNGVTEVVGSTTSTIHAGDMSETSLFYKGAIVARPGGGWTPAEVNSLSARIGNSSDVSPNPYWDALLLEVDYPQAWSAPASTALPSISGAAAAGGTLTVAPGTWTGSPTSRTYQWQRCNSAGTSCASIIGATGTTFTLTSTDVGSTIRVVETATNAWGSTSATSAATAVVSAAISIVVEGYDASGAGPSVGTSAFGLLAPNDTSHAEARVTVTTASAGGYTLGAHDPDANGGLYDGSSAIPWHTSGSVATPVAWSGSGIAISAFGGAATPARWCSGGQANCTAISDADLLWAPLGATSEVVTGKASAAGTGDTTRVPYRLTVPTLQPAGAYSGQITFTATAVP